MTSSGDRAPLAAKRDMVLVVASTLAFAGLSVHFELSEAIAAFTLPHERFQLDEVPMVLLFLASGLAWFAWRRVVEARAELNGRRMAERRLHGALADNRRLTCANVDVQEQERRRLARELHDELGQYLNAIKVDAVCIRDGEGAGSPDAARGAASIIASIDRIQGSVGDMIRRLRPAGLDELGLAAALEECVDGWRKRLLAVRFELVVGESFPNPDEGINIALYRVVQEGLTNVAKHANARRVDIGLELREGASPQSAELVLTLFDDGVGALGSAATRGLGLIGMRERLEALGGRLDCTSAPGAGFRLVARVPMTTVAA